MPASIKIKRSFITGGLIALLLVSASIALIKGNTNAACGDGSIGVATVPANVQELGNYRLYVRLNQPTASTKSVQLELNGVDCYTLGITDPNQLGSWNWVNYQNGDKTAIVNLNVTKLTNSIKISGLSPSVQVDRIMLVPSPEGDSCTPTNTRNVTTGQEPGDNCKQFTTPDPVVPAPTITSFSPVTSPVLSGSSTKLVWATKDAAACTILTAGTNATAVGLQNSTGWQTQALTADTMFSLVCENSVGKIQKDTTVKVTEPVVDPPSPDPQLVTFTPQIADIKKNGTVTYTWASTNSTLCKLTGGQTSVTLPPNGTWTSPRLRDSTQFSLSCFASDGRQSNTLNSTVRILTGKSAMIDSLYMKSAAKYINLFFNQRASAQSESIEQSVINDAGKEQLVINGQTITLVPNVLKTLADGTVVVGGLIVLDPSIVASTEKAENIDRVEYRVDGTLEQTDNSIPYAFDTSELGEGRYELKETVYFKDGSIQELNGVIAKSDQTQIVASTEGFVDQNRGQITLAGLVVALIVAALFSWWFARKLVIRHNYWKHKGF